MNNDTFGFLIFFCFTFIAITLITSLTNYHIVTYKIEKVIDENKKGVDK